MRQKSFFRVKRKFKADKRIVIYATGMPAMKRPPRVGRCSTACRMPWHPGKTVKPPKMKVTFNLGGFSFSLCPWGWFGLDFYTWFGNPSAPSGHLPFTREEAIPPSRLRCVPSLSQGRQQSLRHGFAVSPPFHKGGSNPSVTASPCPLHFTREAAIPPPLRGTSLSQGRHWCGKAFEDKSMQSQNGCRGETPAVGVQGDEQSPCSDQLSLEIFWPLAVSSTI